jgi:hypothetical protein
MLAVMCHELEALLHSTSSVELERAKRAATSMICNALESKATSAEDIGRQMLTYGQRYTGAQYVDMMAQVGRCRGMLRDAAGCCGMLRDAIASRS